MLNKRLFRAVLAMAVFAGSQALSAEPGAIALPEPAKSGGVTLTKALSERRTGREFADVDLSPQELSDLLWATAGVNRTDGKTTYPVARNRRDMTVYVFVRDGVYRYDADANALQPVVPGDCRAATGTQPFVGGAAVNLAYVQDLGFWDDSPERGRNWGFAHAGAMMQNAYLFSAGKGWSAVVRGMFDQDVLKKLLNLSDTQQVRLVQSIGPEE